MDYGGWIGYWFFIIYIHEDNVCQVFDKLVCGIFVHDLFQDAFMGLVVQRIML
jgi:hypothetical protein